MSLELKTTLMKLEEERKAAWFNKDEESLLNLLADDFREVNIFGRLDKDFIIQNLFKQLELLEFDMSYFQFIPAGDETAILTYQCWERIRYKGEEVSGDFHVSTVYRKMDEEWKLLLWQITPFMD
jgi:hypothetical protein